MFSKCATLVVHQQFHAQGQEQGGKLRGRKLATEGRDSQICVKASDRAPANAAAY